MYTAAHLQAVNENSRLVLPERVRTERPGVTCAMPNFGVQRNLSGIRLTSDLTLGRVGCRQRKSTTVDLRPRTRLADDCIIYYCLPARDAAHSTRLHKGEHLTPYHLSLRPDRASPSRLPPRPGLAALVTVASVTLSHSLPRPEVSRARSLSLSLTPFAATTSEYSCRDQGPAMDSITSTRRGAPRPPT